MWMRCVCIFCTTVKYFKVNLLLNISHLVSLDPKGPGKVCKYTVGSILSVLKERAGDV